MTVEKWEEAMRVTRSAYERQRETIRNAFAGRFVGMACGRVLASGRDFDAVVAELESLQPKPDYFIVFRADEEPRFEMMEDRHAEILN